MQKRQESCEVFIILYVSRFVGADRVGIVDTDTGEENILTMKQLVKLVSECTVTGARYGMTGKGDNMSNPPGWKPWDGILITPYQDESTVTRAQLKCKLLRPFLHVTLYGSTITLIEWQRGGRDLDKSERVRLSDFGSVCGDYMLIYSLGALRKDLTITFVLDDNIKVNPYAFALNRGNIDGKVLSLTGARIDIREVTNQESVNNVYSAVWSDSFTSEDFSAIIDTEERKAKMIRRYTNFNRFLAVLKVVLFPVIFPFRSYSNIKYRIQYKRWANQQPMWMK